jgi:hypothetical protein
MTPIADTLSETIIKAMREEIWATNQMQLGAFMENNKLVCPPPVNIMPDPGIMDAKNRRINAVQGMNAVILATCLILAFYLTWIGLLFRAVYQRAHHHEARRQSSQRGG